MQQLGSMMAVDMLVNNFDRSPLIWSHQGNANNFMFSQTPEGPVVVAIDNTTQAITHPDGRSRSVSRRRGAWESVVLLKTCAVAEEQKGYHILFSSPHSGAKAYYDKVTTAVREACQGVDKSPYITKVRLASLHRSYFLHAGRASSHACAVFPAPVSPCRCAILSWSGRSATLAPTAARRFRCAAERWISTILPHVLPRVLRLSLSAPGRHCRDCEKDYRHQEPLGSVGGERGTATRAAAPHLCIVPPLSLFFPTTPTPLSQQDTFKAFTQAGWGEAGISKIDMTFVEKVRDAMAEAIEA